MFTAYMTEPIQDYLASEDRAVRHQLRNAIVEQYMGLVRRIGQRIAMRLPPTVDLDDLVSDGVIGLIDAVDKYDAEKNDNFKKYAQIRIQGAILDGIRSLDWAPRSVRRQTARLQKVRQDLNARFGRPPTAEELARELGLTREAYEAVVERLQPMLMVSFDELRTDRDGEPQDAHQFIEDGDTPDPLNFAQKSQMFEIILECIEELKERQQNVIWMYYFEDLKFREIGDALGVTESRISQLHSQSLQKLKLKLYKRMRDRFAPPIQSA
jgi:RNA polymerase sigma factor FliA